MNTYKPFHLRALIYGRTFDFDGEKWSRSIDPNEINNELFDELLEELNSEYARYGIMNCWPLSVHATHMLERIIGKEPDWKVIEVAGGGDREEYIVTRHSS